jgi:hypothetical protein
LSTGGKEPTDSPEAKKALEMFLKKASPAATAIVDQFMLQRHTLATSDQPVRTVDAFLLDELHAPEASSGAFAQEWRAFATGAIVRDRSDVAAKAWNQWRSFGSSVTELAVLPSGGRFDPPASAEVDDKGVARLAGVLSSASARALLEFVLAERTEGERKVERSPGKQAEFFSRVLCPKDAGADQPTTRWDVRLPWNPVRQGPAAFQVYQVACQALDAILEQFLLITALRATVHPSLPALATAAF